MEDKIKQWAKERKIDKCDPKGQLLKLMEELGELTKAEIRDNEMEIKDSVGDIYIVLVNYCNQRNINLMECVNGSFEVIKNRKGQIKNGIYIKN